MEFDTLPEELLQEITTFLPLKDILNSKLICFKIFSIFEEKNKFIWDRILKNYSKHGDYIPYFNYKSELLIKEHYLNMKEGRSKNLSISVIGDKGIKSNLIRSYLGYDFIESHDP